MFKSKTGDNVSVESLNKSGKDIVACSTLEKETNAY